MSFPSLSVCLVTRNEEANLPRVLGSVAGVADEVIVIDTGSSDRTVVVSEALGARVGHIAWEDDFSAARNAALDRAQSDWILWLNPDEELLPESCAAVPPGLRRQDVLAFLVSVQEVTRGDQPEAFTVTAQPRLFRRQPEIRYVGRLHPRFAVPLEDLARSASRKVAVADITLRHHAYLSVLTEDKLRWAARLLELELADRPGELHYLIEYGQTLLRLNDSKGHAVLAEAVDRLLPHLGAPSSPAPTVGRLVEYLLTVSPAQCQARLSKSDALLLAARWFPESPPVVWAVAQHWFLAGDFRRAAEHLEKLVTFGKTGTYDRSSGFDPSIVRDGALVNLGACYIQLGVPARALPLLEQILPGSPYHAQARKLLMGGPLS